MVSNEKWYTVRKMERVFLLLIAVVLGLLFFRLISIEKKNFEEVPSRLRQGSMVNLNTPQPDVQVKHLLQSQFYLQDARDIEFAGNAIAKSLAINNEPLSNVGELNKRRFHVNADEAFVQGGESYKKRVKLYRNLLGFVDEDSLRFEIERNSPPSLPATINLGMGNFGISGVIYEAANKPMPNVLVRLETVVPHDSLYSSEMSEDSKRIVERENTFRKIYFNDSANNKRLLSFSAYVRTDAAGKFSFNQLPDGKAFEVLPLKPGYQFGASKGVVQLTKNIAFNFFQQPHNFKLFSTRDFSNLKKEKAFIVRTPAEVIQWWWIIGASFVLSFFIVHILLSVRFPQADQLILPVVMVLTGLSFLTLISLQDPLRDRFLARDSFYYLMAGMLGICILLLFDLRRFTPDSALYRMFVFKSTASAANGWPWAILAVGLLVLTIFFGTGPEGSGVKVNLFGFQPSEMVKIFIIIFLAGYFTAKEKFISEYTRWQKRWSFFSFALFSIVAAILLFLMLGDLGPAMVVCFMFIILFSFARGDFLFNVAAVVLYVACVWLTENLWLATGIAAALLIISSLFVRKGLSESSVMTLVTMASFLLLDKIPYLSQLIPGPVQRLTDRKAIWLNPWNNEVFGGDQIANGIWAMSSGGITGQGIGEGFAKTIPEAHTDMILPSIGEEFGWAGILCIFILFLVFLHRSIIVGRQTGRSFLFYLCAGIGVGTFVQFLLIAGGSTDALPLSGVTLPYISYGGSSLIINLLLAGFLLSASNVRASAVQTQYISKQQDRNLVPALVAACIGILLLGVNVSRYLFYNKKWLVEPALVADRSGARIFSYNPRISLLMDKLQAGTLYDRQGRILATSRPELITQQKDTFFKNNAISLQPLLHSRLDRYYPFADHLFFWVGDNNTGLFMGGTNGYFAEYEHMAELRGFPTPESNFEVTATRFREDRFLPAKSTEMTVLKRDYIALAPLLMAGINSNAVDSFKQRNRDLQLTVDAALQTQIQKALQANDSLMNSRVSVVIMHDATGDVLASASYPLPSLSEPEELTLSISEQNKLPYWVTNSDLGFTTATQPGSTAKLVTAMAAFNKLGIKAEKKIILIRPQDLIRIKSEEPDETGSINIERGIVRSNNPFFIRLANEEQLQEEMGTLYLQTGMFLRGSGGYYYSTDFSNTAQQNKSRNLWRNTEFRSLRSYNPNNIRRTRGRGVSGMAWGQGELIATPASIARVASGIANKGLMLPNRYVLKISDSILPVKEGVKIAADTQYAHLLANYMKKQSVAKVTRLGMAVAGKTGTPERIVRNERINDGWYVFFAPKPEGEGHIVTCIRIENCKGSSVAVQLAGSTIIPILKEKGYIKSFETAAVKKEQKLQ